jgi:hypothetical protein
MDNGSITLARAHVLLKVQEKIQKIVQETGSSAQHSTLQKFGTLKIRADHKGHWLDIGWSRSFFIKFLFLQIFL